MEFVIGIDIGGTKISGSLLDKEGNIIVEEKVNTDADKGRDAVLKNIESLLDKLPLEKAEAIGIGTPGFIDSENGIVNFAGNIKGWTGLNLKKAIEKIVDIPVFIENDANIALLCEKWIGAAKEYNDIVMITLGTGLGGAVYNKDMGLLKGSNFQGAELGHMILYPEGHQCTCGQKGCAETYCAGNAIANNYYRKTGLKKSSEEIISSIDNDIISKEVIEQYELDLAYYLTTLKNVFDPEIIIIGGGVINSRHVWWDKVIDNFNKFCNNSKTVKIVPAKYLNNAGMIGAGKIAFERNINE